MDVVRHGGLVYQGDGGSRRSEVECSHPRGCRMFYEVSDVSGASTC